MSKTNKNFNIYWKSISYKKNLNKAKKLKSFNFKDNFLLKRRDALKLMGASLALAGIGVSCRRPEERIMPYNNTPESVVPGMPSYYATMQPRLEGGLGLVVESHEGRPTKIEGNINHSSSVGKSDSFAQASILELYDQNEHNLEAYVF